MGNSGTITGLGQLHISVTDIDRSVAWYRDILGLTFLFQVPGQSMAFFDCGGVRLYLGKPENESFRSTPIMYFTVANIDEAVRAISDRGGKFTEVPHVVHNDGASELWLAGTADPDGTPVIVMETRVLAKEAK